MACMRHLLAAVCASLLLAWPASAQGYEEFPLVTCSTSSFGYDITPRGAILIGDHDCGENLAIAPAGGTPAVFRLGAWGVALDDAGRVLGGSGGVAHLWGPGGGDVVLSPLPGYQSADPRDLDEAGVPIGVSYTPGDHLKATRWDAAGRPEDLGAVIGATGSSYAGAVNAGGTVVVQGAFGPGVTRAFRVSGRSRTQLQPLYAAARRERSEADAISSAGHVAGMSADKSGALLPVLWGPSGGAPVRLPVPRRGTFRPTGVNSAGIVLGQAHHADGSRHGVAWRPGRTTLFDLGAAVRHADAINDDGWVTGYSQRGTGYRAYRLQLPSGF